MRGRVKASKGVTAEVGRSAKVGGEERGREGTLINAHRR